MSTGHQHVIRSSVNVWTGLYEIDVVDVQIFDARAALRRADARDARRHAMSARRRWIAIS